MRFSSPTNKEMWRKHPIACACLMVAFFNWFLFTGICAYLGGDATNTRPSVNGFILKSHGHHTPVSESVWLFSLIDSGLTLLLTPLVFLIAFIRVAPSELWRGKPWFFWIGAGFLVVLWLIAWETSIGGSLLESIRDWSKLH